MIPICIYRFCSDDILWIVYEDAIHPSPSAPLTLTAADPEVSFAASLKSLKSMLNAKGYALDDFLQLMHKAKCLEMMGARMDGPMMHIFYHLNTHMYQPMIFDGLGGIAWYILAVCLGVRSLLRSVYVCFKDLEEWYILYKVNGFVRNALKLDSMSILGDGHHQSIE